MIIPPEQLTEEVIRAIVESYVTREGTDYGEQELGLGEKVAQLLPRVIAGGVLIIYDEATESVNLLPKEELASLGIE